MALSSRSLAVLYNILISAAKGGESRSTRYLQYLSVFANNTKLGDCDPTATVVSELVSGAPDALQTSRTNVLLTAVHSNPSVNFTIATKTVLDHSGKLQNQCIDVFLKLLIDKSNTAVNHGALMQLMASFCVDVAAQAGMGPIGTTEGNTVLLPNGRNQMYLLARLVKENPHVLVHAK